MLVDNNADAQTLFAKSMETKDFVQNRTTSKVTQNANPLIRVYRTSHFTKCPTSKNKAQEKQAAGVQIFFLLIK